MKKLIYFLFFTCIVILSNSCDFVTNPVEGVDPGGTDTSTGVVIRKVLIEDYTGHKCTNCPQAATVANNLVQNNNGNVIVVATHAGFFSTPSTVGTNYLTDFRTTAGTTYDTYFAIGAYPNGMINRKYYPVSTTTYVMPYGSWATETAIELAKPASAKIEIKNTYTTSARSLICEVTTTFLTDTLTGGPYKLIVCLTQDSIVATQLDGGIIKPSYLHRHALRDNLLGASGDATWGQVIANVPVTKNTPIVKTYNYVLPATYPASGGTSSSVCVPKHCEIVAYLYNDVTKEVIQVEQEHVVGH